MSGTKRNVELTDQYWDCDCEHFYIHPASDECCEICSAVRGECPDSRVDEVLAGGYTIEKRKVSCGWDAVQGKDFDGCTGCPGCEVIQKSVKG